MTLHEILEHIESPEFQANISALSGFRTVLNAFAINEMVIGLWELLQDNPSYQQDIFNYIKVHLPKYESGYSHPDDITITVLLYALDKAKSIGTLETIIHDIADKQEFWWARYMAHKILQEQASGITHTQITVFYTENPVRVTMHYVTNPTQVTVYHTTNPGLNADYSLSNVTESSYQAIPA